MHFYRSHLLYASIDQKIVPRKIGNVFQFIKSDDNFYYMQACLRCTTAEHYTYFDSPTVRLYVSEIHQPLLYNNDNNSYNSTIILREYEEPSRQHYSSTITTLIIILYPFFFSF